MRGGTPTSGAGPYAGCGSGGVLHSARYERKPRGGPSELPPKYERRASFCCAAAGCRERVTPRALRFWGRRVYLGPVFLLVFSMHNGTTRKRTEELAGAAYAAGR